MNNACSPCIAAAAGTELARTSFLTNVIIFINEKVLQFNLHSPTNCEGSSFHSLSTIPHCCPPKGLGPCLSSDVADQPLRPAKDHRLGKAFI